jgi:hypothetical protein
MRTYNLFSRKAPPDLVCAVPEDHPVPSFVNARWEFAGRVTDRSRFACPFNHDAAEVSVQFNGFYLFQRAGALHEEVAVAQSRPDSAARTCASRLSTTSAGAELIDA